LGVFLGLTTRDLRLTVTAIAFAAVVVIAVDMFAFTYLLGMRIVVDDDSISKVYFFGLLHRRIRREQLRVSSHTEHSGAWSYQRVDFESANERSGFGVYPFWVWRSADVDLLVRMAALGTRWQVANQLGSVDQAKGETISISLLFGAALLALGVGISNARAFPSTRFLDVTAGLLAFTPVAVWARISGHLPRRPLIVWAARALCLALVFAIPTTIWIVLHGPPCPPNCGPGT
jgi:hypothetical protein